MSSTASELNALASTTTIDIYKRNISVNASPIHYVKATKWFTVLWGGIAILVASVANLFDNLIQLVNIIGSIFYGNVLGVFLLAFFVKFVKGHSVFIAAIINQFIIFFIYYKFIHIVAIEEEKLSYLWLNLIGCVLVMFLAIIFEIINRGKNAITK
jgi:Na+/proline symporter